MMPRQSLLVGLGLVGLLFLAVVFAPLLANDKPIFVVSREGQIFLPAMVDYPMPARWKKSLAGNEALWRNYPENLKFLLWPPIPYSTTETNMDTMLEPPSASHWMGTDGVGRDVAARMVYGTVVSLTVGISAMLVALSIGVLVGSLAGYMGGVVDTALSRIIEIVFSFPSLFLILALIQVKGSEGIYPIIVTIGVTRWTGMARYVRGEFLSLRERDFVRSAKALGASNFRIIFRHILPHSLPPVLVTAAFAVSGAILLEASLSFLGIGIQPPSPTWGNILSEAQGSLERGWWLVLWPAGCIFLTVLGFSLIGEGLRDRLDPRLERI